MSEELHINPNAAADQDLNESVLKGDVLNAFDKYYADDVVMQENNGDPFVGKATNREREVKFLESVEQFHDAKVLSSAISGDTSFSEWEMDVTFKGAGRVKLAQVAVRRWKDGKVAFERFYYKG
ncbi:MAG: nuclear transport factor 2 family protein [Bryobacteraceae bacterium]|nr:nuclear transport factor 2 family protein [Bryobacteraceae bacterium]